MAKPITFRALKRVLLAHDSRFTFRTGKGSEVKITHPAIRATCCLRHHGDGDTVGVPVVRKVERTFALPRGTFESKGRHERRVASPAPCYASITQP